MTGTTSTTSTTETERTTESVVIAMLKQRVGTSFLDSGGTAQYDAAGNYVGSTNGYGRHFERNQLRDFDNEPLAVLTAGRHGFEFSKSVYHHLVDSCDLAHDLDTQFHAFANEPEQEHESWLAIMDAFAEKLREDGREVAGLYGDGDPFTENTYNHENALTQDLQYLYMEVDGSSYAIIQVHGGADIRGGYSTPHVFEVDTDYFFDVARGDVACDNPDCEARWETDNGGHRWRSDDRKVNDLEDYKLVEAGEQDDGSVATPGDASNVGWVVYGDGAPTCPHCGTGRLSA